MYAFVVCVSEKLLYMHWVTAIGSRMYGSECSHPPSWANFLSSGHFWLVPPKSRLSTEPWWLLFSFLTLWIWLVGNKQIFQLISIPTQQIIHRSCQHALEYFSHCLSAGTNIRSQHTHSHCLVISPFRKVKLNTDKRPKGH